MPSVDFTETPLQYMLRICYASLSLLPVCNLSDQAECDAFMLAASGCIDAPSMIPTGHHHRLYFTASGPSDLGTPQMGFSFRP
jgi:hypothetical protein